jgi:hypothetical protein
MNTQANKEQRMFTLVDQWRSSELSRDEFCRMHHIKVSTFSYWITRKNKTDISESGSSGFVRVDPHRTHSSAEVIEMVFPNGVLVRVEPANRSQIGELLRLW